MRGHVGLGEERWRRRKKKNNFMVVVVYENDEQETGYTATKERIKGPHFIN